MTLSSSLWRDLAPTGVRPPKFGAKRTLVVGLLIQAMAAGAYFFARQLDEFYAVALVFGLAYGGVMPLYAMGSLLRQKAGRLNRERAADVGD